MILTEVISSIKNSPAWYSFWQNNLPAVLINPDGSTTSQLPHNVGVLSGSFNPLHIGHRKLAEVAEQILQKEVVFELSIVNVDKPLLPETEILHRIPQFITYHPIAITKAATFLEKAILFPGATFAVGYDTAARILSAKYYDDEATMQKKIQAVADKGAKFLVACRLYGGELRFVSDLQIPKEFLSLFKAIPVELFRVDISSTLLREKQVKN